MINERPFNGGTAQSLGSNPSPPTYPEKPVHPQELPLGLRRVLEDLAKKLPTTQVSINMWDLQRGFYDRTGGNRRNWILAWEDGFCNFAASTCEQDRQTKGLHPDLFFKMSHEIYNYGEGLIGKVAADHSHKWVFNEPQDHDTSFLSTWSNAANSQPRTWEAHFQSGVQTIALIAVREGVVQLGSLTKVMEDLSFVMLLRKNFTFLESIPGVLLPHPSSSAFLGSIDGCGGGGGGGPQNWPVDTGVPFVPPAELYDVTPSMSSLESLLSMLPPVVPPPEMPVLMQKPSSGVMEAERVAKEEHGHRSGTLELDGECSTSVPYHVHVSKADEGL
ncbi:hypothetical protein MUK42_20620 [Musa troglodytarum]|uniref:Transcription factor MYC/MYB N-terminal domain-containing protein n=2 Tax=Musa troglodytarum TaxID=320322 RepID=A0A9E7K5D1_9LILI|nr:hypothetical protein MUK42_20620 [Musa troglodytarum]